MKKIDARKLSPEAQEEKRRQAIRLYKKGQRYKAIAELIEVHADTVGKWVRAYLAKGLAGVESQRRGKKIGSARKLTLDQEEMIQNLIIDKTPDQLKLAYALWTRKAVMELVKEKTGVVLAIRTIGNYLASWGFTPQKPLKQAYEQSPTKVKAWLEEEYPIIQAQAKKENAEIYWGDETGMRSDCQHGRGYAPKGQTPVIKLSAKRASCNMISAISNQGKVRFQIYDSNMNADVFIGFLKRLIKDANRKVILILDNLRVHHAKVVKAWLLGKEHEIELRYLPSYSPELNPDEYLNCDLKAGVHSKPPSRSQAELKAKVLSHMRMLQKKPGRVKKYFKHSKIRYAA
jgi:transposase